MGSYTKPYFATQIYIYCTSNLCILDHLAMLENRCTLANTLTHRDATWSLHWTTCHNVWWRWSRTDASWAVVGTRVRWSHARPEENGRPVHLPNSYYTVNSGTTAVLWDTSTRPSPWVCRCHWSVYLWDYHSDACKVQESSGVDTSGGSAYDVYPQSRNCAIIGEKRTDQCNIELPQAMKAEYYHYILNVHN